MLASLAAALGPPHPRGGPLVVYSWQPLKQLTGRDGARHAGMMQRLMQVISSACRLDLEVFYISAVTLQDTRPNGAPRRRRSIFVDGCRVQHFVGSTEQQYSQLVAQGVSPLAAFVFYTGAWFSIEQRAIRNSSGWAFPDSYLDEESFDVGIGRKAVRRARNSRRNSRRATQRSAQFFRPPVHDPPPQGKLLQLFRADHPGCSVVVFTDDIQSEKLGRVLPAARREEADAPRVQRVVRWMRRQEVRVYSQADAVATVSAHDAAWILGHLEAASLVDPDDLPEGFGGRPSREVGVLPFIAWPAPPADATPDATPLGRRQGLLYVGVAHTAASQSMRWFLREVHPLIQTKLRAKGLNESAAAEMGRLRIVGWGWKEHARKGPGCTRDSRVVGRGARCAGTQRFLPRRGPGKEQGQEPGQPPVAAVDAGDAAGDEDDSAEPAAGAPLSQEASSLAVVHAPPLPTEAVDNRVVSLVHSVDDETLTTLFAGARLFVAPCPYCTGVPTKVVTALRHGVPVVTTPEATRGITDFDAPVVRSAHDGRAAARAAEAGAAAGETVLDVHGDADGFADAAVALLLDDALWRRRAAAALHHARLVMSEATLDARLRELLDRVMAQRCKRADASSAAACAWGAAAAASMNGEKANGNGRAKGPARPR